MQFNKIVLVLFTLVVTAFFLAGCSSKTPSQTAVEQAIRAKMADPLKSGFFDLESVKKTNGHPDGENKYAVEAEIKLKFKKNYADLRKAALQQSSSLDQQIDTDFTFGMIKEMLGNFTAGEEKIFKCNYILIKTEKGWLVSNEQGWLGI